MWALVKTCNQLYLYYYCAGKDPLTVGRVQRCPSRRVRADRLDALVWTLVRELLQDPHVILQEYALWQQVGRVPPACG